MDPSKVDCSFEDTALIKCRGFAATPFMCSINSTKISSYINTYLSKAKVVAATVHWKMTPVSVPIKRTPSSSGRNAKQIPIPVRKK